VVLVRERHHWDQLKSSPSGANGADAGAFSFVGHYHEERGQYLA
jgi:hypothetical protein